MRRKRKGSDQASVSRALGEEATAKVIPVDIHRLIVNRCNSQEVENVKYSERL